MSTLAIALVRTWVRIYTRGLPAQLRDTRRAEIECDLWEQGRDEQVRRRLALLTARDLLGRVLRGVPSDLSWRLAHRARRGVAQRLRLVGTAAGRHSWTVFPALVALAYITGVAKIGTPDFVDTPERLAMAAGAAAILCGTILLWRGTAPVAAAWLVCAGALAPLALIAPGAPLSLLWAALAMRSAVRRCDALRGPVLGSVSPGAR